MKKLLFLLLLLPAIASAQKCITKTDEFTGKLSKVALVSLIPSSSTEMPLFSFSKVDSLHTIEFVFQADIGKDNFDSQKMLLMVKFEDGTIKIYHSDSRTLVTTVRGLTTVAFLSGVSNEDLYYFRAFKVSLIRLSYKGDENVGFDNKIREGKAQKIMDAAACVL